MNKLRFSIRNPSVVTTAIVIVVIVAILLAIIVRDNIRTNFPLPSDEALRVQYLEQYIDLAQIIAVGVVVTLIGVIIPLLLPEARDKFERYKESRLAYSRAKTAVIYLPDRVLNLDREKAFLLVEKAHREIHFAETFEDVIIRKGYLKWFASPDLWILYNYWQIVAVAEVLRTYNTDASENKDILRNRLKNSLDVVHKRFGRIGENCKGEKWSIKDGSRFREEDKLEESIKQVILAGLKK